jgi:Chaperone of endosialidase
MACIINASTSTGLVQTADLSGNVAIQNNGTTAVTVTGGNVGIGTTSPSATLTTSASSGTILAIDASSSNDAVIRWTASGVSKALGYWTPGTDRLYFATGSSGGVYLANGGTSWTSASDERTKENLIPITDAVKKVNTLRAVTGNYINDSTKKSKAFLISQDVLSVLPEAVDTTNQDEYGLSYTDVIPLLVASIKEQQALIESLTTRITALEAK